MSIFAAIIKSNVVKLKTFQSGVRRDSDIKVTQMRYECKAPMPHLWRTLVSANIVFTCAFASDGKLPVVRQMKIWVVPLVFSEISCLVYESKS